MVERVAALLGRLNEDLHLLAHVRLADVFGQQLGTNGAIEDLFFVDRFGGNQAIGFNHYLPLFGLTGRAQRVADQGFAVGARRQSC